MTSSLVGDAILVTAMGMIVVFLIVPIAEATVEVIKDAVNRYRD